MNNEELDLRIRACGMLVRDLIDDLQSQQLTLEQAVALGALLACACTLDTLAPDTADPRIAAALQQLLAAGLIEPAEDAKS